MSLRRFSYWCLLPCVLTAGLLYLGLRATQVTVAADPKETAEVDVLSAAGQKRDQERFAQEIEHLTREITKSPNRVELYSRRGDERFFRRDFAEAVADYEHMLKLQPDLESRHWRLGLAWYYAGKYAEGARQFEKYYETDDVDRENGLWRFLCQSRQLGLDAARKKMLKYDKPDRGGLGDVYRMYAGELNADQILKDLEARNEGPNQKNQRLFYAELYIGLFESVQNKHASAAKHLEVAVRNPWPKQSGGGPEYMWQVARLHCILEQQAANKKK